MAAKHRKRFDRWRRLVPRPTKYLIEQVLHRLVPAFESEGFVWYDDYAGADPNEVGGNTIPLQIRAGTHWPTAEIHFPGNQRPFFSIYFAALPQECRRLGQEPVPRERAIVVYAPAYFWLCKGRKRNLDSSFGYQWFSMRPFRRLNAEVTEALGLLPEVFSIFCEGIPRSWLTHEFGPVQKHVFLAGSWHLFEQRRKRIARERETDA